MASRPHFPSHTDPFRWWSDVAPDRVALVDHARGTRRTYRELDREIESWARLLHALRAGPGDRIATLAGNRAEQVALFHACGRIRAVLVPLNWRLAPPELTKILANARPTVVVGESRFRSLGEASAISTIGARWIDLDAEAPGLLAAAASAGSAPPVQCGAEDAALILYTSGSTGTPKGAVLPHRQLLYNAIATTTAWELGADDVAPVATPFFHTGGWNVFATPLWHRGGRVVLFDRFDPAEYLDGLAEEGCTVALTIPTQLLMMLESAAWGREMPALRWFISGGAPCPGTLMERVRSSGFAMKEGYGLTECGPNCFAISLEEALRKPGVVGHPVPFLETRLVRGDGTRCEAEETGELLLRGPQMFSSYFDDPVRTAEAVDEEGWLHTGDLASHDVDGAFRIRGRRKEMFISGGENVYPGEVEVALCAHPRIAEVSVIGVGDRRWGEVGRAFVVPRHGESVAPDEVIRWAREQLGGYKVPKSVVVLDALPRLGSGKVDRGALAALAATATGSGGT